MDEEREQAILAALLRIEAKLDKLMAPPEPKPPRYLGKCATCNLSVNSDDSYSMWGSNLFCSPACQHSHMNGGRFSVRNP